MSELADTKPIDSRLDADRPTFVSIFGKKGEGKSVLARRLWDSWPRDELCIDIPGDAIGPGDVDHTYRGMIPDFWPEPVREDQPARIRYVPDPKSPTYLDDLDRAVGLALKRKGSLVWIDEVGIVIPNANSTKPNMRHLLQQGRHDRMSTLFCGPRPVNINPLVLAQSDVVYIFKLPNPNDRRRIADECGIDPKLMDDAVHSLGSHEYLKWDGTEITSWPPLPMERLRKPRR